jgi:ASC-1-like (ASCH) protein
MKTRVLRIPAREKRIFDAIRTGRKKIETRAATDRYEDIQAGDTLRFVCEERSFTRRVVHAKKFKSIEALLRVYGVEEIDPDMVTQEQLETMYDSFPEYPEKIKKFGLMAFVLGK